MRLESVTDAPLACPHCSTAFDFPEEHRLPGIVVLACPRCHGAVAAINEAKAREWCRAGARALDDAA